MNLKPKDECQGNRDKCKVEGCPKFGTLNKKGRVRGCGDPSAQGARNRRNGLKQQNVARKALGVPATRNRSQSSNEENWRYQYRVEVKSGKQVESLVKRFLAAEAQSDLNKAIGDPRDFLFVAMPEGMSDGIVALRLSVWARDHKGEE